MNTALEPAHEPGPVTAEAPSNIAFIKYWGARDLETPVPFNRSLSMTLDACRSICSASPLGDGKEDEIVWVEDPAAGRSAASAEAPPSFVERTRRHLDRLRGVVAGNRRVVLRRFPDRDGQTPFRARRASPRRLPGLPP